MRIPVTMVGLVLAVSCSANAADPLGVTGGLGGGSAASGGLGAGPGLGNGLGLGAGTGLGAGGGAGAGLGRAANLGAGGGLGAAGGLQNTGGLGVNGNLGASGGLNLVVPGRAGANLGVRTQGALEANIPGVDISTGAQGAGHLRARDRRLMRPDAPSNAGEQRDEPQSPHRGAAFDSRQSAQTHLSLQAESVLNSRLSQIDRMRDQALVTGNVDLLTRADALESQVRFEHQQWMKRTSATGASVDQIPTRGANTNVDASAYFQGAAQGAAQTRGFADRDQLEMRGNGLIQASGQANQAGQFGIETAGRAVQQAETNYDAGQFGFETRTQARQRANAAVQSAGTSPTGDLSGRAAGGAGAAGRVNEGAGVGQFPAQLRRDNSMQGQATDARFFGNAYGQAEAFGDIRNGASALPGQPQQFQGQFQGSAQGSANTGVQTSRFTPRTASPAVPASGRASGQGSAQGASTIQSPAPTPAPNPAPAPSTTK